MIDDPTFDKTDWAHPAWFRGCDHGINKTCNLVLEMLDGKHVGPNKFINHEKLQEIYRRINELNTK